jgi:hypothetical protein
VRKLQNKLSVYLHTITSINRRNKILILCTLLLIIGGAIWKSEVIQHQNHCFTYIKPSDICEKHFKPFDIAGNKESILQKLQSLENSSDSKISIYMADLTTGRDFFKRIDEKHTPASLLKVPLMMAFFKLAETDPTILTKKVVYTGERDANNVEYFRSPHVIQPGTYTIDQLIASLVKYSDNNAAELLNQNIDKQRILEVYKTLGMPYPPSDPSEPTDYIYVTDFAKIQRALYYATYLTPEYSKKALQLLTKSDFQYGIRSIFPSSIKVSEKFGERELLDPNTNIEYFSLHDCSIIYKPQTPLQLCIMTKGHNYPTLLKNIQELTRFIYDLTEENS